MADARTDQEPSIEEILASIREIISDEEPASEVGAPESQTENDTQARESDVDMIPDSDDDDDILDLSAFAIESDTPATVAEVELADDAIDFSDPIADEEPEPEFEPTPAPEPEPVPEPVPEPKPVAAPAPAAAAPVATTESLLTEQAKAATLGSLTKLAQNIAISKSSDGNTIEDLVREMLRPMLREWLDSNLPPMIERMVERELERLVKQALDR